MTLLMGLYAFQTKHTHQKYDTSHHVATVQTVPPTTNQTSQLWFPLPILSL
jgi:hypothetical protein